MGFTLLYSFKGNLIIDLISVHLKYQRKRLASAMIEYAMGHCGRHTSLLVGTQISNSNSIRTYENLGFNFTSSNYVFHYHGPFKIEYHNN